MKAESGGVNKEAKLEFDYTEVFIFKGISIENTKNQK